MPRSLHLSLALAMPHQLKNQHADEHGDKKDEGAALRRAHISYRSAFAPQGEVPRSADASNPNDAMTIAPIIMKASDGSHSPAMPRKSSTFPYLSVPEIMNPSPNKASIKKRAYKTRGSSQGGPREHLGAALTTGFGKSASSPLLWSMSMSGLTAVPACSVKPGCNRARRTDLPAGARMSKLEVLSRRFVARPACAGSTWTRHSFSSTPAFNG